MWLKPENRCLVPANRFAEYAPEPNPETKKDVVWFVLNEDRPLFAFAGIRTEYRAESLVASSELPSRRAPCSPHFSPSGSFWGGAPYDQALLRRRWALKPVKPELLGLNRTSKSDRSMIRPAA